jgi:hypothetical protein
MFRRVGFVEVIVIDNANCLDNLTCVSGWDVPYFGREAKLVMAPSCVVGVVGCALLEVPM